MRKGLSGFLGGEKTDEERDALLELISGGAMGVAAPNPRRFAVITPHNILVTIGLNEQKDKALNQPDKPQQNAKVKPFSVKLNR